MTYTMFVDEHGDKICRITSRIGALFEITLRGTFFQELIFLFASFFLFIYIKVVFLLLDSVFFFEKNCLYFVMRA